MDYPELKKLVDGSKRIVFFGGAGVSTESGIPDFRSVDGLYNQRYKWPPEEILSRSFFERNPEEFFRFYRDRMLPLEAKPNKGHIKLAEWEKQGKLLAIVTQNIDGLHQAAGSKQIFELHGSIWRNHCMRCRKSFDPRAIKDSADSVPRCECGGIIKPDVVLYEEGLDERVLNGAIRAISRADLLIVAGTSLVVQPAAGLIWHFSGEHLVIINRDPTPMDARCELVIRDNIGEVLSRL